MPKAAAKDVVLPQDLTEATILEYAKRLALKAPNQRASHLLNLAMSALKLLILKGESDLIRLNAAKAILDLPLVQARLSYQTARVTAKPNATRSDRLAAKLQKLLSNGHSDAVLEALGTVESTESADNPMDLEGNP